MISYLQFAKRSNLTERLLSVLGILTKDHIFICINNHPDYDITGYQRDVITNYFFHNSWNFSEQFQSLVDVEFIDSHIIPADSLTKLNEECSISDYRFEEKPEKFLTEVYRRKKDLIEVYSYGIEVGEFRLNELRLSSIDNQNGRINYEGSFNGDSNNIEPMDWDIYSLIAITGIPNRINSLPFYKGLISESYILYKENKFKLAYFIAFSAFENFIDFWFEKKMNTKQQLEKLFQIKKPNISEHHIYSSLITHHSFDSLIAKRNTIAHAKSELVVTKQDVEDAFQFFFVLITAFEHNCSTFDELNHLIENRIWN